MKCRNCSVTNCKGSEYRSPWGDWHGCEWALGAPKGERPEPRSCFQLRPSRKPWSQQDLPGASSGCQPIPVPTEKAQNMIVKLYKWNIWIYSKNRFYLEASSQIWRLLVSNYKVIFNRAISKLSSRSGFLCTLQGSLVRPLCSAVLALHYIPDILF